MISGCASSLMKPAANQTLSKTPAQSSRVIFLRPSSVGGAIQASLFDATGSEPKFIGISSTGTKVVYDTTPGAHRFMVVSEAADFLEARLAAGKTYYAVVTPRMGAWKARFSLWPIKNDANAEYKLQSDETAKWIKNGKVVENTPESLQWAQSNMSSIKAKYSENLPVWNKKPPQDIAERTLNEGDGRVE